MAKDLALTWYTTNVEGIVGVGLGDTCLTHARLGEHPIHLQGDHILSLLA